MERSTGTYTCLHKLSRPAKGKDERREAKRELPRPICQSRVLCSPEFPHVFSYQARAKRNAIKSRSYESPTAGTAACLCGGLWMDGWLAGSIISCSPIQIQPSIPLDRPEPSIPSSPSEPPPPLSLPLTKLDLSFRIASPLQQLAGKSFAQQQLQQLSLLASRNSWALLLPLFAPCYPRQMDRCAHLELLGPMSEWGSKMAHINQDVNGAHISKRTSDHHTP